MATIFYQNNGCSISDTVFITPSGDQYPIRNISSVKVRQKDYWWILCLGLFILLLALSSATSSKGFTDNETLVKFLIAIITLAIWWYKRKFILWIGSGGVHQEALTFPKAQTGGLQNIQEIYTALNASIAALQNG